jgi:VanZ family protein
MLFTLVAAGYDEIHQTFIPSRTGRWQDVVIDSCGAAVMQIVIYLLTKRAFQRRLALQPAPELMTTR